MNAKQRSLRRRQLDELTRTAVFVPVPKSGWVRTIREALGMSLESFGRRLGVTPQTANQLERAEVNRSITLKRLETAADALGCDLTLTLVPRSSLEDAVRRAAHNAASVQIERMGHSMALELQGTDTRHLAQLTDDLTDEMIASADQRIWQ